LRPWRTTDKPTCRYARKLLKVLLITAAVVARGPNSGSFVRTQDLRLGFLPQVLGGWYGSSTPAAGQTYTVDLTPAPAESNSTAVETADVASHDDAAQTCLEEPETFEDAQLDLPADDHVEKEALSDDLTHPAVPSYSTTATEPGTGSTAALSNAVLLCLLSATLTFLLVLLGTAAGSARHTLPTHAPAQFGLTRSSLLYAGLPLEAPAAKHAGATAVRGGEAHELPWWLWYNTSGAARKAGQGEGVGFVTLAFERGDAAHRKHITEAHGSETCWQWCLCCEMCCRL
jgi:hypothetical protein